MTRRGRPARAGQPRDVRGRYARARTQIPPWWFILIVVGLVFAAAYLL
ncbi:hypothetical protein ACFQ51_52195 [Streptomyces kaempferi]